MRRLLCRLLGHRWMLWRKIPRVRGKVDRQWKCRRCGEILMSAIEPGARWRV